MNKIAHITTFCSGRYQRTAPLAAKRQSERFSFKLKFCEGGMIVNMTKEQFEREKNHRISPAITKSMLDKGFITDREYKKIDTILKHKYRPVFGSL